MDIHLYFTLMNTLIASQTPVVWRSNIFHQTRRNFKRTWKILLATITRKICISWNREMPFLTHHLHANVTDMASKFKFITIPAQTHRRPGLTTRLAQDGSAVARALKLTLILHIPWEWQWQSATASSAVRLSGSPKARTRSHWGTLRLGARG